MAEKATVTLENEEMLELERIVIDHDEKAALEFLQQVVWHRARKSGRKMINPRQGTGSQG
ncbi:MAG: hypothetical protein ACYC1C_10440 [Chloroflexota bacterium]